MVLNFGQNVHSWFYCLDIDYTWILYLFMNKKLLTCTVFDSAAVEKIVCGNSFLTEPIVYQVRWRKIFHYEMTFSIT